MTIMVYYIKRTGRFKAQMHSLCIRFDIFYSYKLSQPTEELQLLPTLAKAKVPNLRMRYRKGQVDCDKLDEDIRKGIINMLKSVDNFDENNIIIELDYENISGF